MRFPPRIPQHFFVTCGRNSGTTCCSSFILFAASVRVPYSATSPCFLAMPNCPAHFRVYARPTTRQSDQLRPPFTRNFSLPLSRAASQGRLGVLATHQHPGPKLFRQHYIINHLEEDMLVQIIVSWIKLTHFRIRPSGFTKGGAYASTKLYGCLDG